MCVCLCGLQRWLLVTEEHPSPFSLFYDLMRGVRANYVRRNAWVCVCVCVCLEESTRCNERL